MIPATDSISITTIMERSVESTVDWFDQHKQSFYRLGCTYLNSLQQMEELFYQAILRVHKEIPRFKNDILFETWVTSIFISICRELSTNNSLQASEESESRQDILNALDHLSMNEREALVLLYLKGLSQEETAHFLHVTVGELKELLFSGIQSLRKELGYGSNFNGCKEYQKDYIDYLERTIDRSNKIDLEIHLYHCENCQEDLGTFQEVILKLTEDSQDIKVPSELIENVKARLTEEKMQRQQKIKKLKKRVLVLSSVFAFIIGIGFFTGTFANIYYSLTEDNEELRYYFQQDLGERLNLEADSNGIKIKIKSVIADDTQTLVFYEIEDTNEDYQYMMIYGDGVFVQDEYEIMNNEIYPRYYPANLESDINKEKKNVYHGKMSLMPLSIGEGTINLNITKLHKLIPDESSPLGYVSNGTVDYVTGEWNFEIPATKQTSIEYGLNEEVEIEGIPVRLDKLIMAPTTTTLQYSLNYEESEKQINNLTFDNIEANNQKLKADMYGSYYVNEQEDMNWISYQTHFDPLFDENLNEITIQFQSVHLSVDDQKTVELDISQGFPQTFEYAGSEITIEKIEVGQTTNVVISDRNNRTYEYLHFQILGENSNEMLYIEMSSGEGVIVDKNGKEYDMNGNFFIFEEIEQPRYFETVHNLSLKSTNEGEDAIPKSIEIYGYSTTIYMDDVVKVSLK